MSLAIIFTRAQSGIHAPPVVVETHLSNGLPGFTIVGMPETAVKESKDRVRSALLNSYFEFPQRRITVNLAPADLPKEGGRYDLAIAIGILAASNQIPLEGLEELEFLGELALSGDLRKVTGCIPAGLAAARSGRTLIAPHENENEIALCNKDNAFVAENLLSVCAHLNKRASLPRPQYRTKTTATKAEAKDLADVKGQYQARRALEVAAAGGHNLLFYGPPGSGKSMLASRLPGILPRLSSSESLEVAAIKSVVGQNYELGCDSRPFRSPHHSCSSIALVGGGTHPKPGEISLAHHGVLFLDELPEYPRHALEVLREPLENGAITISRANAQVDYPANFQLIAAMNPCPCGYLGDKNTECRCTPAQITRYRNKISGPLLDRIDLHVAVHALPLEQLQEKPDGEPSAQVRARVEKVHSLQLERQNCVNASLTGKNLQQLCKLGTQEKQLLAMALKRFNISGRAYDRILRVARTLADMSGSHMINTQHLTEALSYRSLDRPITTS